MYGTGWRERVGEAKAGRWAGDGRGEGMMGRKDVYPCKGVQSEAEFALTTS